MVTAMQVTLLNLMVSGKTLQVRVVVKIYCNC